MSGKLWLGPGAAVAGLSLRFSGLDTNLRWSLSPRNERGDREVQLHFNLDGRDGILVAFVLSDVAQDRLARALLRADADGHRLTLDN
jgi:hypothetical protein